MPVSPVSLDHRPRVERALRHIVEHLDEPLLLADVARVAALSPWHFHRIFQAYTGEPVGRFITRARLERAARMLAYERHLGITEIGLACGYSSSSNFAKAFAAWFGMSPTALREAGPRAVGGKLAELHGRTLDPRELYTVPAFEPEALRRRSGAISERLRYEAFAGAELVCLASPTGYVLDGLVRLWEELIARAQQLGLVAGVDAPVDAWGVVHDSPLLTAPERCRYHASVPCAADVEVPAPLFRARIPEGRYAVFSWSGPVDEVDALYRDIYSVWLPASSVELDDHASYDRYVGDWPEDGRVELEVWLKIRARSAR
ncbi:MAG: AraC family transcriptional regulator [Nannocystaceae bacterium]